METVDRPSRSPEMSRNDITGAEAAAEYFLASYVFLQASGDTKSWDALSESGCEFCASSRRSARELLDKKQHLVGGAITINTIRTRVAVKDYSYLVMATISQAPLATANEAGDIVSDVSRTVNTPANLVIHWVDGEWRLRGVDFSPSPPA